MKLTIPVEIEAPDDATHYFGDHTHMSFYKKREIGVAGDHWFGWSPSRKDWTMTGHHQPHWIQPIPEEWKK